MLRKLLLPVVLIVPLLAGDSHSDRPKWINRKQCRNRVSLGGKNAVHICKDNKPNWIGRTPKRLWVLVYHDPETTAANKQIAELVKELADSARSDPLLAVGSVGCTQDKDSCSEVEGLPMIQIVKSDGKKETMKEVLGSQQFLRKIEPLKKPFKKIQKKKCDAGLFEKTKVIPFCLHNFPDAKDKRTLVVLYNTTDMPEEEQKKLKDTVSNMVNLVSGPEQKRRARIENLAKKYDIATNLGKQGPNGMEELASVGAFNCGLNEDARKFCVNRRTWRSTRRWLPMWVNTGIYQDEISHEESATEVTTEWLTNFVLEHTGYVAGKERSEL